MKKKTCREEKWVIDVRKEAAERIKLLEAEINERKVAISKAPKGTLRVISHEGGYQCFYRDTPQSHSGVYIQNKNIKLAYDLAQKDYNQKFIKTAEKEMECLKKYIQAVGENEYDEIYEKLSEGRKKFVKPIITPTEELIRRWESMEFEGLGFKPTDKEFYTDKNERVRSKSEILIANMLKDRGVPYHYEYPVEIDGDIFHPDFYTLNVRKRKVIIWEHYGMMDDLGYARDNVEKINKYMLEGYVLGDNYIQTFETSKNPINAKVVKKIIEDFLL